MIPSDQLQDVSLRVANVLPEPLLLAAGTAIADLQPLTTNGSAATQSTLDKSQGNDVVNSR